MHSRRSAGLGSVLERLERRTLLSSGRVIQSLGRWDNVNDMLVQPDGKVVLLGYTDDTPVSTTYYGPKGHAFLARYLTDGTPDGSFGQGGKVISPFTDGHNSGHLAPGPDGSIFVGGNAGPDGAVTRFRPDGSLHTAYGTGGRAVSTCSTTLPTPWKTSPCSPTAACWRPRR